MPSCYSVFSNAFRASARCVTQEAEAYATEAGLLFAETSAKENLGVTELFHEIGQLFASGPLSPCCAVALTGGLASGPVFSATKVPTDSGPRKQSGVDISQTQAPPANACSC